MKRTIAVAVLGAFCGSAFANGGQQLNAASANAAASAKSSARATGVGVGIATAKGGTAQATGGIGQGFGGQGGAGGSVNYSVPAYQTITSNGRTQIETVPNVYAPNIYPTAPCMGSSSAGAGWLGFGMSGGTSWTDHECQLQEAARNAPTQADRVFVWCKTEAAKGAPSCQGIVMPTENGAVTGSIPVERERRADATVKTGDPRTWGSY